jgi:hypothetical protein
MGGNIAMCGCKKISRLATSTGARASLVSASTNENARGKIVLVETGSSGGSAGTALLLLDNELGLHEFLLLDDLFLASLGVAAAILHAFRDIFLLLSQRAKHSISLSSPTTTAIDWIGIRSKC